MERSLDGKTCYGYSFPNESVRSYGPSMIFPARSSWSGWKWARLSICPNCNVGPLHRWCFKKPHPKYSFTTEGREETFFVNSSKELDYLDGFDPTSRQKVFRSACKLTGRMKATRLTTDVRQVVVWFVLNNSPEVDADIWIKVNGAVYFPSHYGGDAGSNLRIETGNASLRRAFRQNGQRPLTIGFDYARSSGKKFQLDMKSMQDSDRPGLSSRTKDDQDFLDEVRSEYQTARTCREGKGRKLTRWQRVSRGSIVVKEANAEAQETGFLDALKAGTQSTKIVRQCYGAIASTSNSQLPRFITNPHNNDTRSVDELARDRELAGEDNDVGDNNEEGDNQTSGWVTRLLGHMLFYILTTSAETLGEEYCDITQVGSMAAVIRNLLELRYLNGDCITEILTHKMEGTVFAPALEGM
ncbi:hypothetical protein Tco_0347926 [Tanacetum coccineum]